MQFSDITILIIDDNFLKDDPLVIELEEVYKSVWVLQSKEGLAFIKKHVTEPLIVLLDVNMPHHLDGHQVLEKIREMSFLIPVIIFTAIQEEDEAFSDFINNRAIAFIKKDDSMEHIMKVVRKVTIELNAQIDRVIEQWILKQPPTERNKPYIAMANGKVYSLNQLLKEIRLQTEVGKQMASNMLNLTIDLLTRGKKQI